MATADSDRRSWSRIEIDGGALLRRPAAGDVPGVFTVHRDPAVYQHDPQEVHPDGAHTARFLEPIFEHWQRHGFGYWSVLVPAQVWPDGVAGTEAGDGHRVIAGLGGIQHRMTAGKATLNVYFRFAVPTQGRGLTRLLMERVLTLAPRVAPGVDLVVRTRPANAVARHVAERSGFIDEGLEPGTTDMQLLRLPPPS
ncbi:GNAT family N-acetyltransferase [Microbacterium sp.]|uniref:GNAT family N-acetyltransferase n=1 Tax=Microbacterium sp. TaxID=51671 RepID=UPI0028123C99|nr:GNAT family N-acetyltransferase [Microbacterium sp.]